MALRTFLVGRSAFGRYLARVGGSAPFRAGSRLRHVVVRPAGGGYEWASAEPSGVRAGLTALESDPGGRITRLTAAYDSRRLATGLRRRLVA